MNKQQLGPCITFFPQPATLITARDPQGLQAVMAASWVALASKTPPTIAVALHHQRETYRVLRAGETFVVNAVPVSLAVAADYCGIVSGRDEDKAARAGLTFVPGTKVSSPLIDECPLNLECRFQFDMPLGDYRLVLGEVLEVHAATAALDEQGRLDARRLDPLVFLGGIREYWSLGEKVGDAYRIGLALKSGSDAA